jgi:hypothetical protein
LPPVWWSLLVPWTVSSMAIEARELFDPPRAVPGEYGKSSFPPCPAPSCFHYLQMKKQVLVEFLTELCAMRSRGNILKPTFIIGLQVSSIVFSLRSTRIWMEGLLYAIRGSSSFAKCLGYSKMSTRDTRTQGQVHPEKDTTSERQHGWSNKSNVQQE